MAAPTFTPVSNTNPAQYAAAVTPHDSTNLSQAARALYIGVGGNIVCVMQGDGAAVTFSNVKSGSILPISVLRVNATNTTASSILALY